MTTPTDVSKMSVKELKALAYDQMALLQQTQSNLDALNRQIQVAQKREAEEADKKPTTEPGDEPDPKPQR